METFAQQLARAAQLNPHLQKQSQTGSETGSQRASDNEHHDNMIKLWVVMTEAYGFKWFKPMGEEPNQTWVEGLRDITQQQWLNGLKTLASTVEEWPPSLPEFKRWCTQQRNAAEVRAICEQRAAQMLEKEQGGYNPFRTPLTHEQYDKRYQRLVRELINEEHDANRREALGLERETDSRRICQDEELR